MTKNEVVLQLTLKLLENFEYDTQHFGGNGMREHADLSADIAVAIYNKIFKEIVCDN